MDTTFQDLAVVLESAFNNFYIAITQYERILVPGQYAAGACETPREHHEHHHQLQQTRLKPHTVQKFRFLVMDTNTASMAPPSEVPVPFLRRRGQRISPQAWDEQRLRLQKLYVDLDMTLPETMRAMENDYNFYARYGNHAALRCSQWGGLLTWSA